MDIRIKPLEWSRTERAVHAYIAKDEHGDLYWIGQSFGSDGYYFCTFQKSDGVLLYDGDDLGDAKAAAQADYERRILSALEPAATQEAGEPVAHAATALRNLGASNG